MNPTMPITRTGPVPLALLRIEKELQPRISGLDEGHLAALMESDPTVWPPIRVREGGTTYLLIDGFHRAEAARRLGLAHLEAEIGPFPGGIHDAFTLNKSHGLALALADRKAHARRLHSENDRRSFIDIARECGLSDKTVKAAVQELPSSKFGFTNLDDEEEEDYPESSTAPAATQEDPVVQMLAGMYAAEQRDGKKLGLGGDIRAARIKQVIARFENPTPQEMARIAAKWGAASQKAAEAVLQPAQK